LYRLKEMTGLPFCDNHNYNSCLLPKLVFSAKYPAYAALSNLTPISPPLHPDLSVFGPAAWGSSQPPDVQISADI